MQHPTFFSKLNVPCLWLRTLGSYAFSVALLRLIKQTPFTALSSYAKVHSVVLPVLFAAAFLVLTAVTHAKWGKNADRYFLLFGFSLVSALIVTDLDDFWPVLLLGALWAALCFYYARQGWIRFPRPVGSGGAAAAVAAAALVFLLFTGAQGVLRYRNFYSPNYDFGIFCNLFYRLRESGVPLTTCERDMPFSHFAVHISPVLYLLWPVYALFPRPETLQLAQTMVLASAAVPAYFLARQYAHSRTVASVFAFLAVLHPAVGNGTNYDFHENCFLLPFLLWAFYFAEKRQYVPFGLFCLLTLSVKEDAALYVVILALYLLIGRRRYIAGGVTATLAAVWFGVSLWLLTVYGDGVMTNRYANLIAAGGGLWEAAKNVLTDPVYALTQIFADKNGPALQKAAYVLQMLSPLAFLPLCCKKPARFLLLGPMVIVNLMTVYPYQFELGFQYSFGSAAFLIYLAVMNAADVEKRATLKGALCAALCLSVLCFAATTCKTAVSLTGEAFRNRAQYAAMETALDEIPENASVACSTCLLPHLANRDLIFEVHYHTPAPDERLDYVIVDLTRAAKETLEKYQALGYAVEKEISLGEKVLIVVMK